MDLTTITPAQFKAQFFRDFPYLPTYSATQLYNSGNLVYDPTTQLFYTAALNGLLNVPPTPATNPVSWSLAGDTVNNYVLDQDITNAFSEAQIVFNQALFGTDAQITLAYLYVTAHYLCNDLKAAMAGINSSAAFPVASKSVGSVSESFAIPDAYKNSPILSFYTSSSYGMKYLSMALPALAGNMVGVYGGTHP